MDFFTSHTKRPIRLKASTRKWAWESLHGKYGTEAMQTPFLDVLDNAFDKWDNYDKYDYMIELCAKNAPIRICDEELVCGSATLGASIWHQIPIRRNGQAVFSSVSHLTIDYYTTLNRGVDYYEQSVKERLKDKSLGKEQVRFLQSLLHVIKCLRLYHERYLKATKDVRPQIYENLLQVPFKPARNFYEAVQSLWFIFSFVRLCGNWPGIGRIDWLLGEYLDRDLQSGVLNLKQAREILASFFIKGTEWIQKDTPLGTGDAQHYQNIVLSGIDEDNKDVTNKVTYLVLDIIEELGISDFPITVRINENTPNKLLDKVAKVMRHGGGIVAIYNEPLILKALTNFGYSLKDARAFANDGCWEVQIPGKTYFTYCPFDSLALLQKQTLKNYENVKFDTFEQLYNEYLKDLEHQIYDIYKSHQDKYVVPSSDWGMERTVPTSVVSLFENGCIEKARSYFNLGPTYNVISPHIGGIADTVNSLYAIKKIVFEEKKVTFNELMNALKNNWNGYEDLQNKIKICKFYGTDNNEVDEIYSSLLHDFYLICQKHDENAKNFNFRFPAGVSTFGREINWMPDRLATAQGSKAGTILAGNTSPTPGTDTDGATAVIKSYCKADLSEMVTGAALDLKIAPSTLSGENGITVLKSLIRSFIKLGGYFLQIDTVNANTLKKAQQTPNEYKTLSVRVSGWNARFITLTKEWQDMIIQRTEHNL
ncbi:MAG: hypothetical protein E7353_09310 [Clostridiales bacterium]|nr:hypothetical protein [Clostridiales bacterium]